MKLVYVLSGGGIKGFCHLGLLEGLEKAGFQPDLIVGTSAGALMGALYSHFGSVSAVRERIEAVLASEDFAEFEARYLKGRDPDAATEAEGAAESGLPAVAGHSRFRHYLTGITDTVRTTARMTARIGRTLFTSSMIPEAEAAGLFGLLFEGVDFASLKIPYAAVAVDLVAGHPAIFPSTGPRPVDLPLSEAVRASCAIPLIFPAVHIGGHAHADGLIMANLPVREALSLLGGEEAILLGLDVSAPSAEPEGELSSLELSLRLLDLATASKQEVDRMEVDILFQPLQEARTWLSMDERDTLVALGLACATPERLEGLESLIFASWLEERRRASLPQRLLAKLAGGARGGPPSIQRRASLRTRKTRV